MATNNDLVTLARTIHPDDRNERVLMILSLTNWEVIEESLKMAGLMAEVGMSRPSACEQLVYMLYEARKLEWEDDADD